MIKTEKKLFGYHFTFSGYIQKDEMDKWVKDSEKILNGQTGKFGVLADLRTIKPLPPDAQESMKVGQKLYKSKGLQRSVVVLNDSITTMQFKRIAKETGIYEWERYIDASKTINWEQVGIDWIKDGKDPDK
jgi:hypothetical protein